MISYAQWRASSVARCDNWHTKKIKHDLGLEENRSAKRIFRQLPQQKFLLLHLKFCFWPARHCLCSSDMVQTWLHAPMYDHLMLAVNTLYTIGYKYSREKSLENEFLASFIQFTYFLKLQINYL